MNCAVYWSLETDELNRDAARLTYGFSTMYCSDLSTFVSKFVILVAMLSVFLEYVLISPTPSVFPIVMNVTNDIMIVRKHMNMLIIQHS